MGTPLVALTVDGTDTARLFEEWSRSARLSPGMLTMRAGDEVVRFRAEGAVIERAAKAADRQLLVRLVPKQQVSEHALERRRAGPRPRRRDRAAPARRACSPAPGGGAAGDRRRDAADGVTARDDGALDFYNRQWRDYTGLALGESVGWGWEPVVHPDDLEQVRAAWDEGRRAGSRRGRGATAGARTAPTAGISAAPCRCSIRRAHRPLDRQRHGRRGPQARRGGTSRHPRSGGSSWRTRARRSARRWTSDQVLRTIARLSVPALADWCTVDMLEPDGSVRRVAVTHADPTKRDIARHGGDVSARPGGAASPHGGAPHRPPRARHATCPRSRSRRSPRTRSTSPRSAASPTARR